MKNKLKLVLWGKGFELPEDYDKLKFDDYSLNRDSHMWSFYYRIAFNVPSSGAKYDGFILNLFYNKIRIAHYLYYDKKIIDSMYYIPIE